jgi:hypothetical protein
VSVPCKWSNGGEIGLTLHRNGVCFFFPSPVAGLGSVEEGFDEERLRNIIISSDLIV